MARRTKTPRRKAPGFVLDGSVALAWCYSDEADAYADSVARKLPRSGAVVPALWHLEVGNAFVVAERRERCDQGQTARWSSFLSRLPIVVDEYNGPRIFSEVIALARARGISAYDAAYLELALRLGLPVATIDRPLRTAALAAGVEIFDPLAS